MVIYFIMDGNGLTGMDGKMDGYSRWTKEWMGKLTEKCIDVNYWIIYLINTVPYTFFISSSSANNMTALLNASDSSKPSLISSWHFATNLRIKTHHYKFSLNIQRNLSKLNQVSFSLSFIHLKMLHNNHPNLSYVVSLADGSHSEMGSRL